MTFAAGGRGVAGLRAARSSPTARGSSPATRATAGRDLGRSELGEPVQRLGLASESRLAACSAGWPMRIRLTGTSSTLPDSVRGTSAIAWTSLGTWRGEQSSRIARADRA